MTVIKKLLHKPSRTTPAIFVQRMIPAHLSEHLSDTLTSVTSLKLESLPDQPAIDLAAQLMQSLSMDYLLPRTIVEEEHFLYILRSAKGNLLTICHITDALASFEKAHFEPNPDMKPFLEHILNKKSLDTLQGPTPDC